MLQIPGTIRKFGRCRKVYDIVRSLAVSRSKAEVWADGSYQTTKTRGHISKSTKAIFKSGKDLSS
jgi:hypothetical protein